MAETNLLARCEELLRKSEGKEGGAETKSEASISTLRVLLIAFGLFVLLYLSCGIVDTYLPSISIATIMTTLTIALHFRHFTTMWQLTFLIAVQASLATAALCFPSSFESLFTVISTFVCCEMELPLLHKDWQRVLVVLRQAGAWEIVKIFAGGGALSGWKSFISSVVSASLLVCLSKKPQHNPQCEGLHSHKKSEVKNMLESISEAIVVLTKDLTIPYCNLQAAHLLSSSPGGKGIEARLSVLYCLREIDSESTVSSSLLEQLSDLFTSKQQCGAQLLGITKIDEKFYEWKVTRSPWKHIDACVLTATDVTLWVDALSRLKKESSSKSDMLRFVSHELRTPANAILNLSSNVRAADNLLSEQRLELSMVITSTYFLLSVVNDLLDFTRIAAEKFMLVKQTFDIRKEIRDAVNLVELQCIHKGLSLSVKFDEFIPEIIYSDPTRLKQVLLNLLGNALKFTFHGGIQTICMLTDRNTLKITVKDTGIGIPRDKIAGLCQMFGKVEGTQRINPQGCGLGLYISNLLALSLGPRPIEINSKVGIGSEFSFEVQIYQQESTSKPGVEDATTDIENERDCESSVSSPSFIGGISSCCEALPTILVVDDSDFNRVVLLKMLETLHLPADAASSGLRALSLIRSHLRKGHFYRLILMDVEMPEMDGITATQEIRSMEVTGELRQRVRIVACSAHKGVEDLEKCISAGMDESLEKPISMNRLRELVQNLAGI